MQTPPTDHYNQKPSNSYSPSVPISVYRELAAELQQAREMVDSLKSQNQQLVKQNQQLQQQVEKVVQSAQHLQQIVASFGPGNDAEMPRPQPPIAPEARIPRPQPSIAPEPRTPRPQPAIAPEPRSAAPSPPSPPPRAASIPDDFAPPPQNPEAAPSPYRETVVIEQEDSRSRRSLSSDSPGEINGWVLVIAILLVVLTAFGTGLIVVRMMFNNNSR
jgi:FtsZ-binding cell division protein ZapB